jgi:TolB-like protein/DNA-binding winged helix-turn-helix (wHTH) protein
MDQAASEPPRHGRICFSDFELDPRSGELFRNGKPVRIQPQPLRVLQVLMERPGQTISREELRERIWGGMTYVEFDQGLNYCIRQIRLALGDSAAKPVYIATALREGYRFLPEVTAQTQASVADPAAANHKGAKPAAHAIGPSPWRAKTVSAAVGLLIAGAAVAAGWTYFRPTPPINSLAVLPLDNLSGDASQQYFADGITDELTTMLAKGSTLRIVSRTSVMAYRSAHRPLPQIARSLGVDAVLEGSVARSGGRVHMNLQLIDGRTDTHLWAESFDREATGAAAIAQGAADTVARRLHRAVARAPVRYVRPEAHDAYLHGHYLWFAGRNKEAGEYFLKAAELQPDYALAWTGVADYWIAGTVEGQMSPKESLERGAAAAVKAVALDDSLAQAHVTMCAATFFKKWNLEGALRECDRAIELDPEMAEAYHLRAKILATLNRHPEAIETERRAMELNPFARPWGLVLELNWARRYDTAVAEARARLESAPANAVLLYQLAYAYRAKGMETEAVQLFEAVQRASGDAARAAEMDRVFQSRGYRGVLEDWLRYWRNQAATRYVSPVFLSRYTAQLGRRDETLALLEHGYEERSPLLLDVGFDPAYDFLRKDNRYHSLMERVGLQEQ